MNKENMGIVDGLILKSYSNYWGLDVGYSKVPQEIEKMMQRRNQNGKSSD